MENVLKITPAQFEILIRLPAIQQKYSYYVKDNSVKVDDKITSLDAQRGIRFAGVEFEVDE